MDKRKAYRYPNRESVPVSGKGEKIHAVTCITSDDIYDDDLTVKAGPNPVVQSSRALSFVPHPIVKSTTVLTTGPVVINIDTPTTVFDSDYFKYHYNENIDCNDSNNGSEDTTGNEVIE